MPSPGSHGRASSANGSNRTSNAQFNPPNAEDVFAELFGGSSKAKTSNAQFNPPNAEDAFVELFGGSSNAQVNLSNAEDVFAELFGGSSKPFGFENMGHAKSMRYQTEGAGIFGGFGGNVNNFRSYTEGVGTSARWPRKAPPVETKLSCTLVELYTGSTRKMKISRNVMKPNGRLVSESEVLTINVKPGWKKGTKITFPNKGNEQAGQLPADLVFVIDEKPHDVYTREGNDLLIYQNIPLVDALAGTTINLKTLDERDLVIKVTGVVTPGYELVIAKEGMPIVKETVKKGNLRIIFDIDSSRLTSKQRATVGRVLGG